MNRSVKLRRRGHRWKRPISARASIAVPALALSLTLGACGSSTSAGSPSETAKSGSSTLSASPSKEAFGGSNHVVITNNTGMFATFYTKSGDGKWSNPTTVGDGESVSVTAEWNGAPDTWEQVSAQAQFSVDRHQIHYASILVKNKLHSLPVIKSCALNNQDQETWCETDYLEGDWTATADIKTSDQGATVAIMNATFTEGDTTNNWKVTISCPDGGCKWS